jgi:uncharacterized protein YcbK (DUF882 family)
MNMRRRELLIAAGVTLVLGPRAWALPILPPRRLALKNANTGESFAGPYRDADGPIPNAMADLAHFLRDHHANKVGPIDIGVIDLLSDLMATIGQSSGTVLSAFRTPETNRMLRARYFGVAEKSQHLLGKALDVTFAARLGDAEQTALRMKRGGVGWYPRSHFIHIDTGPVRHWQLDGGGLDDMLRGNAPGRMDLAALPPHHVPTDKELMLRYHAYARREFLARQGK